MKSLKQALKRFNKDVRGIETIELALMAALIAIASIGAATIVGEEVSTTFGTVSGALQDVNS